MSSSNPSGIPPLPGRPPEPPRKPGVWRALSARQRGVALALCIVAVGVVGGVIAAQSDGEGASASASDDGKADLVDSVDEPLQACADSWNDGNENKANVASIATVAQAENPTVHDHGR
jgi:hypothetical protein